MENFNRAYNDELAKYAEEAHLLVYAILNHTEVRAFVYEVCKQVLHGDGEKGEVKKPGCSVNCWQQAQDVDNCELCELKERDDQPAPSPTRAEWEAWVKTMPMSMWTKQVQDFFLSMPIVPKEAIQDVMASTLTRENKTRLVSKILQVS